MKVQHRICPLLTFVLSPVPPSSEPETCSRWEAKSSFS